MQCYLSSFKFNYSHSDYFLHRDIIYIKPSYQMFFVSVVTLNPPLLTYADILLYQNSFSTHLVCFSCILQFYSIDQNIILMLALHSVLILFNIMILHSLDLVVLSSITVDMARHPQILGGILIQFLKN